MKKTVDIVFLIPVGPKCRMDYICDTILSIKHYCTLPFIIIMADDSGKDTGTLIKNQFDDVIILTTPKRNGKDAGLYMTLSQGFSYALEFFEFRVCLRMDTDALILGHDFEREAIDYFRKNPDTGIIGSYRVNCLGEPRLFSKTREILFREKHWFGCPRIMVKHPIFRIRSLLFLRKIYRQSFSFGYEPGEHCMGGAYFISYRCIEKLHSNALLARTELRRSILQEDQIFGLLIHSVGMKHGDFATGNYPMGLSWKGLPCSPETLVRMKKKVIHSTKFFEELAELDIREYFRKIRIEEIPDMNVRDDNTDGMKYLS